ncbi:NAD(+) synthase [Clostridia bacterium]|nr:NAD(+) synthase [Clostridia bacterium]
MEHGFIRIAAATPHIRVGNCKHNQTEIINQINIAHENAASLIVFPELCITGYSCGDLFLQKVLLDGAKNSLLEIANATKELNIIAVIGVPIATNSALYNCAAVILHGEILAFVPKQNVPTYSEFYEQRHFTAGTDANIDINGKIIPIKTNAVFSSKTEIDFTFGVELCEDLWVANSPSISLAASGANIILNLSASNEVIGKPEYKRSLIEIQSAKLIAAYAYANAGFGESTTDMVFSGGNMIAENGVVLSRAQCYKTGVIFADIDLQKLTSERRRITTYKQLPCEPILFDLPSKEFKLNRVFGKTPFVPDSEHAIAERCAEILSIQSTGLATRLMHTGIQNVILGLSGGLDSTLALIVAVKALDFLKLDRKKINAITMPCFGTTKRTKSNAEKLAEAYGVTFLDINITDAVNQHFKDINQNPSEYDVTFENSQARERTQILMDIANKKDALVIGTGDLSELALGWATYNGDHMSMYAVNCSVPKTLVRYLVQYESTSSEGEQSHVLADIVKTPVSPELLPPADGDISQKTEEIVGPYELHDFFLYYFMRFGFTPAKLFMMAKMTFKDDYTEDEIKNWLTVFIKRFFAQQFKRSCLPDGPKVGSVTLSPRGDWRMPSDASAELWLSDL